MRDATKITYVNPVGYETAPAGEPGARSILCPNDVPDQRVG
ncbi:hypothetical protein [Sphingomonas sp. Leaf23]|nr:hypothetical protein [Sphingomonas sp. Leaf23]